MESFALVWGFVGTTALFGAALCAPDPVRPAVRLTLVVAGETEGRLAPCGCSSPQMGGLPRRAALLRLLKARGPLLAFDSGDLIDGWGRQQEMKAETAVDIAVACGEDAVALGERDLALGPAFLQALAQRADGRLLCANLIGPSGERPLPALRRIRRVVAGRVVTVAVIAILDPALAADAMRAWPGWRLEPPAAALASLSYLRANSRELRVLLYHGPAAAAVAVAARFDVVVTAHDGDQPGWSGTAQLRTLHAGTNGRAVVIAQVEREGRWRIPAPSARLLDPALADDPVAAEYMLAYEQRVSSEDLLDQVPRSPLDAGDSYVGSASCKTCHTDIYNQWRASGHSHALATLAKVSHDRDPECVSCHVVGLDRVGGYRNSASRPDLAAVGCESCHGPAGRHAHDPAVRLAAAGERSCQGCHVPDQSPRFRFSDYWPRIRH